MPAITFGPEFITGAAGMLISLLFTYIAFIKIQGKPFNVWFAEKSNEEKQSFMLLLMTAVTVIVFALGCFKWLEIENFVCTRNTAISFFYSWLLAISANQGTDRIFPKPIAVRQARDIVKEDELYKKPM
jgi:hypothetical protein